MTKTNGERYPPSNLSVVVVVVVKDMWAKLEFMPANLAPKIRRRNSDGRPGLNAGRHFCA